MSEFDNVPDNEMDRLLQGAFESRPRRAGSSPSMVDVRHRARRHQRRRVSGVVGATAVLGACGVAVLASRGSPETGIAGDAATSTWAMTEAGPVCGYTQVGEPATTITWLDTTLPSEATSTTYDFASPGCVPLGSYRCVGDLGTDNDGYTHFEYCEPTADYPTMSTTIELVPPYTSIEGQPPFATTTSTTLVPTTTTSLSEFAPTTTTEMPATTTT